MSLRALVVARWYPSHDDPGRGSFVADLVEALGDEGIQITVASWENAFIHGPPPVGRKWRARAARLWSPAVARPDALNTPRRWGARVPVARLPALRLPQPSVGDDVEAHAALLLPFGVALAERWPFDVIHAHTGLPDGLAAVRLARKLGVSLVVTEHDSSLPERLTIFPEAKTAYRRLIREADRVFAVSGHFRSLLCGALGLPDDAIQVLPNPIPPVFFAQSLEQPRDPNELLYVGHRKETKGITVLLRATAMALAVRPELRLRLIGGSDTPADEEHWHDLAGSLGVMQHVHFEPPLDRAGVARSMARAGILVQPSPFETFGIVAAEALACGLPVAATPSGVEEILGQDGAFGEVAESTNPEALAAAILRLLERRAELEPARLREVARERYAADAVARQVIGRYQSALGGRPYRYDTTQGGGAAAEASVPRDSIPPLVIGFTRPTLARRLGPLPPALASRLTLLTDVPSAGGVSLPAFRRLIEIDLEADYRARMAALGPVQASWTLPQRVWHVIRAPRAALTRRRVSKARENLRRRHAELRIAAAITPVLNAWQSAGDNASAVDLLPLDVDDVLAAQGAIDAGARLAPGSTRWLADRWDERRTARARRRAGGDGLPPAATTDAGEVDL